MRYNAERGGSQRHLSGRKLVQNSLHTAAETSAAFFGSRFHLDSSHLVVASSLAVNGGRHMLQRFRSPTPSVGQGVGEERLLDIEVQSQSCLSPVYEKLLSLARNDDPSKDEIDIFSPHTIAQLAEDSLKNLKESEKKFKHRSSLVKTRDEVEDHIQTDGPNALFFMNNTPEKVLALLQHLNVNSSGALLSELVDGTKISIMPNPLMNSQFVNGIHHLRYN